MLLQQVAKKNLTEQVTTATTTSKKKLRTGSSDILDSTPGQASAIQDKATSSSQSQAAVRGKKDAFDLRAGKALVVPARIDTHERSGASSSGPADVKVIGLGSSRIVLENISTNFNRQEDVILQRDKHGGFFAVTSGGEWTMSPPDKKGIRELSFSPDNEGSTIVNYRIGVTNWAKDQNTSKQLIAYSADGTRNRASMISLPNGKSMLRFTETDLSHPTVIYFDSKTGKGEGKSGKATLGKPDADGERRLVFKHSRGSSTVLKLAPYDGAAQVSSLAGKSASVTILAPKSYAPNGDASSEMEEKRFDFRFGQPRGQGSSFLDVKIDQISWPDDLVAHPTARGDLTINLNGRRLWLKPDGEGGWGVTAQWSFRGSYWTAKLDVADMGSP